MKFFIIFMIIPICFVGCDEEFGQRIGKSVDKSNSTNKESDNRTEKKDLDTHESLRTYEYALAPIEVQTHYPKVIAEEHTLHELPAHSLTPQLLRNEPIILTDDSHNYGSTSKSVYGAQRMPKLFSRTQLPIYTDDPKDQLKGYLPIPLKPALPMSEFSQNGADDEMTIEAKPRAFSALPRDRSPYPKAQVKHIALTGYSMNNHLEPGPANNRFNKIAPIHSQHRQYHSYRSYSDHIPGIPGKPWKDYPIYDSIPNTHFKCRPHSPGYFADVEAGCQVWHFCQLDGRHDRFLCPNGTLFNQKSRVCDWWHNVDCHSSVLRYGINADLYREPHIEHKKYFAAHNPINQLDGSFHSAPMPVPPVPSYRHVSPDLLDSGHGLALAESRSLPPKIRRVKRVRSNKSNSTEPQLLSKHDKPVKSSD